MSKDDNQGPASDSSGPDGGRKQGDPGHETKFVTIIVNGKPKQVEKGTKLDFWAIVTLAFPTPQTGDGIQYTVQFTHGGDDKPSGALVEGQSVKVKDGMEFDVTPTNRS